MKRDKVKMLTRTAILLAVVVVVQMVGRSLPSPSSSFIVGPLVNMCLLIATAASGLAGGIAIAVLVPFTSLISNHAPIAAALLPFAPVIAISNVIFILVFYFLYNKNKYVGVVSAAVLKFGFLFISIRAFLNIFDFPKFSKNLIVLFSYPQLITALIGGFVALPIIIAVNKATNSRNTL
ncbi:MAG TPA: ECF transporter S component [Ruminiclostridium sp.]